LWRVGRNVKEDGPSGRKLRKKKSKSEGKNDERWFMAHDAEYWRYGKATRQTMKNEDSLHSSSVPSSEAHASQARASTSAVTRDCGMMGLPSSSLGSGMKSGSAYRPPSLRRDLPAHGARSALSRGMAATVARRRVGLGRGAVR
jgi:hypothetical protein